MNKYQTIKKIDEVRKQISTMTTDLRIIERSLSLKKQEKELNSARNHLNNVYTRLTILKTTLK